jgi:hypothetical protein
MIEEEWEENPNYRTLEKSEAGDIVHLKHTSGFRRLVKVIVSSVKDDEVTGVVEAVFDWDTEWEITGGAILNLVGKELTFKTRMVHRVIKKPVT